MRRYIAFQELPHQEREIGLRVSEIRRRSRLSQAALSRNLALTRDQLANIEVGRVALRFGVAWALCGEFNINPLWLAFGEPEQRTGFVDWGTTEISDSDEFAHVMNGLAGGYSAHREQNASVLSVETARGDVKHRLTGDFPIMNSRRMSQRVLLWPRLRKAIARLVRKRGAKAALAHDLGVTRQAVDAWLNDRRDKRVAPSAELTLRLLRWVEEAEAKQKPKDAGRGSTRPAPKTRTRKTKNENKPSSERRKK